VSLLNPNVFYEFGIRIALNKPISMVKDDHTRQVPFDTSIINYHEYKSGLNTWEIRDQIDELTDHLTQSINSGKCGYEKLKDKIHINYLKQKNQ
jgi:hypothetical protein